MLLTWVFALVSAASCSLHNSDLPPDGNPDFLLNLLESTYGRRGYVGDSGDDEDAGEPLLLTPFVEQNQLKEAREAARVDSTYTLPGLESYAGYLTVNEEYNSNLWFWYFPVPSKVEETPWIIWLQGGPGASSMFGLFTEIGPFVVSTNLTLEEMKHSWAKNHSLLFIDNPVGTGFSFTNDSAGYATNQTTIGENLYTALQQFLTIFPELRKAPLTIAGESYAGKHIPSIGFQILKNREKDQLLPINLQGLAIGNGFIDPYSLMRYSFFVREIGLVDDHIADYLRKMELKVTEAIGEGLNYKAFIYYNYLLSEIEDEARLSSIYNFLGPKVSLYGRHLKYLERSEVRRALHVGNTKFSMPFVVYNKLVPDFMNSAKMWLEELIDSYRVMLYNGHLDIIVAYHPSVNTYNSLTFNGSKDYRNATRRAWYHGNEVAGYYKIAGNLTEVMVLGAGHMVPSEKPAQALGLISAFARGLPISDTARFVDEE